MSHPEYSPGLQGVIAGITRISAIDVERSSLTYRGYDVHVLADKAPFEEVAYLLLNGELPTQVQLDDFDKTLKRERELPGHVYDFLRTVPSDAHPMDTVRAGVAVLAFHDPDKHDDSQEANYRKAVRLAAKMGTLVANGYRIVYENKQPVTPDDGLGIAADFLHVLKGTKPDSLHARTMNASLILYAEHGYNASTFAARVTVSTLSDLYSGTISAIGALKGPLHGGANEKAMGMMLEIGDPSNAKAYIQDALANKKKVMGFGHREYRKSDSRTPIMNDLGAEVSRQIGNTKWLEMARIIEKEMWDAKQLFANIDFPSGWVYYLLDLPIAIYTPIFTMARTVGWSAHMIEQLEENRIIRPTSIYEGVTDKQYVPISQRG